MCQPGQSDVIGLQMKGLTAARHRHPHALKLPEALKSCKYEISVLNLRWQEKMPEALSRNLFPDTGGDAQIALEIGLNFFILSFPETPSPLTIYQPS